jgi:hypothetical protein
MNILMTGHPNQGCAPIKIVNECLSREKKISAPDSKSKVVGRKYSIGKQIKPRRASRSMCLPMLVEKHTFDIET